MILLLRRRWRTVLDGSGRQRGRHPLLEQFVGDIDDRAVTPSGLDDVADLHLQAGLTTSPLMRIRPAVQASVA